MTMNDSRPLKLERRWYQLSLRTLLVFVLAVGVGFGLISRRFLESRSRRTAAAEL